MRARLPGRDDTHRIAARLAAVGLRLTRARRIGAEGALRTYVVDAAGTGAGESARYVAKTLASPNALTRRLGLTPTALLQAEKEMTEACHAADLGPPVVASDERCVVREYWDGTPLGRLLAAADKDEAAALIVEALALLRAAFDAVRKTGIPVYLDFNGKNVLRRGDGRLFFIDHEWAALIYPSFEEMEVNIEAKFLIHLLAMLPSSWTADELFALAAREGFPEFTTDAVRDRVARAYFRETSPAFAARVHASPDLMRRLAANAKSGTPKEVLRDLCRELNHRNVRWCFRRSYRALWAGQGYDEKDIDLHVHPGDLLAFTDVILGLGFASYRETEFLRYCETTNQCLAVSADYSGFVEYGELAVPALLSRCVIVDGRRHLETADQVAVHIASAVRIKGFLKESYAQEISSALRDVAVRGRLRTRLAAIWPEAAAARVVECLAAQDWTGAIRTGRRAEARTAGFAAKLRAAAGALIHAGPRIVALLGVDGAGKSTALKRASAALQQIGFGVETVYLGGYYPPTGRAQSYVLPTDRLRDVAAAVLRKKPEPAATPVGSTLDNHDEGGWTPPAERGGFTRRLALAAYGVVLLADSFLMGLRLRAKPRGAFLLADRYFYDLVSYFGPAHPLSRIVARLPSPDRAIFLYADPAVQAERAPRHSIAEIRANQALYRLVPAWNPRLEWSEVCTELPLPVTVQKVLVLCLTAPRRVSLLRVIAAVASFLARRAARLLPGAHAKANLR